jgi:surfactin synthase thioesterase subunit
VTRGGFELRVFSGNHFYLVPELDPVVRAVLRDLAVRAPAAERWPSAP